MIHQRLILLLIFLIAYGVQCQTKFDLENKKKQIENDIKQIELKLSNSLQKKDLIVSNAEDINYKIKLLSLIHI